MLQHATHPSSPAERHAPIPAVRLKSQLGTIARQARASGLIDLAVFVELAELAAEDAIRAGY